jgi:hypothetical protein
MQIWIRQQDPNRNEAAVHEPFKRSFTEDTPITPA